MGRARQGDAQHPYHGRILARSRAVGHVLAKRRAHRLSQMTSMAATHTISLKKAVIYIQMVWIVPQSISPPPQNRRIQSGLDPMMMR
jgi:hypothetical protein